MKGFLHPDNCGESSTPIRWLFSLGAKHSLSLCPSRSFQPSTRHPISASDFIPPNNFQTDLPTSRQTLYKVVDHRYIFLSSNSPIAFEPSIQYHGSRGRRQLSRILRRRLRRQRSSRRRPLL